MIAEFRRVCQPTESTMSAGLSEMADVSSVAAIRSLVSIKIPFRCNEIAGRFKATM
jgi:hypothetical protein